SADRILQKRIGVGAKERNVVDEVHERHVGAVEDRRTPIVFPADKRIADRVQVESISSRAGSWILSTGIRVRRLKTEAREFRPQLCLQRVVNGVGYVPVYLDAAVAEKGNGAVVLRRGGGVRDEGWNQTEGWQIELLSIAQMPVLISDVRQ